MTDSRRGTRVGGMFGPYELRSLIGAGGMGEVYQAYDTGKGRIVAVKLLHQEYAADPTYQERFRRESRLAARLHEPHIIPVHDFGEIDGVLYIDMRLVEGSDLKTVLAQVGPLPPTRAVSIVEQVAAALDAAHASGLTHRDIKPENVLLTGNDFAYLVDFGIARFGGDTGLTSAGSAIGSCAYMAPERFTGGKVGPAADVYSLACLLYEALTGHPPFPTGDLTRLMSAHIMSPPPRPSASRPNINPAFDDVIAWGMAKNPTERCPSAGELARAASSATAWTPAPAQATVVRSSRESNAPTRFAASAPEHLHRHQSENATRRSSLGRPLAVSIGAAVVVLTIAVVTVTWMALDKSRKPDVARPPTTVLSPPPTITRTTVETAPSTTPTTTIPPRITLPGTDTLGFVAYPGARCDPGQVPAAMAETTQSALVICRTTSGDLYYRGVRLRDNAGIELGNVVPSSGGFDVANPTDGTLYQIRRTALTIVTPDGQVFSEPMVQYASSQ
jgi:serine/threonine protein kinase